MAVSHYVRLVARGCENATGAATIRPIATQIHSANQFQPSTFQGSVVAPNLCNGGSVRFDQGGTFSAAFQVT